MPLNTTRLGTVAFVLLCTVCVLSAPALGMTAAGDGLDEGDDSGIDLGGELTNGSSHDGFSDDSDTDSGSGSTVGSSNDSDSGANDTGTTDTTNGTNTTDDADADSGADGDDENASDSSTVVENSSESENTTVDDGERLTLENASDDGSLLSGAGSSTAGVEGSLDRLTGDALSAEATRVTGVHYLSDLSGEDLSLDSGLETDDATDGAVTDDVTDSTTTLEDDSSGGLSILGEVVSFPVLDLSADSAGDQPGSTPAPSTGDRPTSDATGPLHTLTAAAGADESVDGSPVPTPDDAGPATGLVVGLGAVAATAAARNGSLVSSSVPALGSALTAGVAPVASFSRDGSALERLFRLFAPFRYSRYDDSDPLEHEARAEVFSVVEESPGAYLSELAEEADIPLSTARHHVRVLEREDVLTGAKVRGKRRFYPAYSADIELAAAMNDESTAAVLDALARLGASSVSDLADELDRDPSTVTHHLQRLAEDDIVVREREGRAVMNRLAPEARTALEPEAEPAEAEPAVLASD